MLAKKYRFTIRNDTGQTLAANEVKITREGWKFASGVLTYEASPTEVYSNASTANAAYDSQATPSDNSTDLYLGANFTVSINQAAATPNGTVTIYYETDPKGNGEFPTNGEGRPVASVFVNAASTLFQRSFEVVGD